MQKVKVLVKGAGKAISDNSTSILTAVAVVGVATTTVMAVKATPKALSLLEAEEAKLSEELTVQQKARVVIPVYMPALSVGAATVACVFAANAIGTKRNAALVGAYSVLDNRYREYQAKVKETIGEKKEQTVRDQVAQDRVSRTPNERVIIAGEGKVLCLDVWSGRYFESSLELIRRAQNDLNAKLINEMYASVNDFYSLVGLPHNRMGDEFGWSSEKLMELDYSTTLSEDGRPCLSIEYMVNPKRGYHKFG